jgi:hypothetical protein
MSVALTDLFRIYRLTPGRRAFALRETAKVARTLGLDRLEKSCLGGLEREKRVLEMMHDFSVQKARKSDPKLGLLDNRIDRTLGAFYRGLSDGMELEDGDLSEKARAIREDLFPLGANAITMLSYVDEQAQVELLLGKIDAAVSASLKKLGLLAWVDQLTRLKDEFKALLAVRPAATMTYDEIRAVDSQGQEDLMRVVVEILYETRATTAGDLERRGKLLGAILTQHEAVGEAFKRRRGVADVDPETGTELAGSASTSAPEAETSDSDS